MIRALLHTFANFDPDNFRTEDLPRWLRPFHRAYVWASRRVTGHAAHALNGVLAWLAIGGPLWLPLAWWWVVPMAFYTVREAPGLLSSEDWLDHAGDVVWVYAVGIALWLPWWAPVLWMAAVVIPVQRAYWSRPAPSWMPDVLWGRR